MSEQIYNIEQAFYQGYIWMSNESEPQVINRDYFINLDEKQNPFVIEGLLYCPLSGISYSIKYVDGRYIVKKYIVDDADFANPNVDIKSYCSNRMEKCRLRFLQYWEAQPDPMCEGMEVNQPAKLVFVGFEK